MKVVFRCPPEMEAMLPKPMAAKLGLPEWLKRMPMRVFSDDLAMEVMTVKKCPPFVDAMSYGFLMLLATDIRVEAGRFSWDWDPPANLAGRPSRSPMTFHVNDQTVESPLFEEDRVLVKFNSFWAIELEPGWSLLVTHPFNRLDLPFRMLTGLVDADLYKDNFVNFVGQWLDPAFTGVLAKGTPIAQCVPVPRGDLEPVFATLSGDSAERFVETREHIREGPGVYRKAYRAKKG
jgi:hypothetical protein